MRRKMKISFFYFLKHCWTQTNNYQIVSQLSYNCTELGPAQQLVDSQLPKNWPHPKLFQQI